MTTDPTDPDTYADAGTDSDVETPEADAAEQRRDPAPHDDDALTDADPDTANEADLAEQARVVTLNEDDYRP
ncbi:hypothetical protein ACFVFQ_14020 [Streptomyces sp. NPDC057743]|uniref:hypothetical protein n=1 Tax=Streptomyces sp. NPDC057743 TaxID=3346236 RepID=UPI00368C434B